MWTTLANAYMSRDLARLAEGRYSRGPVDRLASAISPTRYDRPSVEAILEMLPDAALGPEELPTRPPQMVRKDWWI